MHGIYLMLHTNTCFYFFRPYLGYRVRDFTIIMISKMGIQGQKTYELMGQREGMVYWSVCNVNEYWVAIGELGGRGRERK